MATVGSSSDQATDLLQKLSLDETSRVTGHEYANKGHGDDGSVMYSQNYGYPPYGMYQSIGDDQLQGLQQYQYPSPYYRPNQGSAPQGGGSTSVASDKVSLLVETNKDTSGNGGSKPHRPSYQYPNLDPNGRGGLSTVVPSPNYQDPSYSFDGMHSPVAWLDTSIFSAGQSKHNANAGYASAISHSNNFSFGRNQNNRPHYPSMQNFHHTRQPNDAFGYISQMYANNALYGHYGNTYQAGPGFGSYGCDSWISGRGWYPVDGKYKPRGYGNGASGYGKENVDGLNELNKGPRAKGFKNEEGIDPIRIAAKGQRLPSLKGTTDENLPLIPEKVKYGGEEFPESYSDAKFFVIKSYSEDDVHKSVKYDMWTSTPNGNKKLDAAYREAKEKPSDCPLFLLFSVNASGQFVGVAEMVGPVDFDKTVEYWQQDKWTGCFPLKWHIIKDIPNSSLRHITLENNENKPVTNSRDTQEVNFEQGIQILKIFKSHSSKRCILDDFDFYEARERIMQQKKVKQHQLRKQISDGKPSVDLKDDNDKDATSAKDRVPETLEGSLVKELALDETNGEARKLKENGSAATAVDAVEGTKSDATPDKKGASNGIAITS